MKHIMQALCLMKYSVLLSPSSGLFGVTPLGEFSSSGWGLGGLYAEFRQSFSSPVLTANREPAWIVHKLNPGMRGLICPGD